MNRPKKDKSAGKFISVKVKVNLKSEDNRK